MTSVEARTIEVKCYACKKFIKIRFLEQHRLKAHASIDRNSFEKLLHAYVKQNPKLYMRTTKRFIDTSKSIKTTSFGVNKKKGLIVKKIVGGGKMDGNK